MSLAAAYAEASARLRAGDRDRWLANLLVPREARPHLDALYAYDLELSSLRDVVTQPMLGEIRLQWWIDGLSGERPDGEIRSHPVGEALLDTVERFGLPASALIAMAEARRFDLYDDPMPSLADLEGYCGETSSVPMRLASLVLAGGRDPGGADATGHAGVAYGLVHLLRDVARHSARGQTFLPADVLARHEDAADALTRREKTPGLMAALAEMRDTTRRHLAAAQAALPALETKARPALLPTALIALYLNPLDDPSTNPFAMPVAITTWRRQWALWRAAVRF